jgi:hypothetical protein
MYSMQSQLYSVAPPIITGSLIRAFPHGQPDYPENHAQPYETSSDH